MTEEEFLERAVRLQELRRKRDLIREFVDNRSLYGTFILRGNGGCCVRRDSRDPAELDEKCAEILQNIVRATLKGEIENIQKEIDGICNE